MLVRARHEIQADEDGQALVAAEGCRCDECSARTQTMPHAMRWLSSHELWGGNTEHRASNTPHTRAARTSAARTLRSRTGAPACGLQGSRLQARITLELLPRHQLRVQVCERAAVPCNNAAAWPAVESEAAGGRECCAGQASNADHNQTNATNLRSAEARRATYARGPATLKQTEHIKGIHVHNRPSATPAASSCCCRCVLDQLPIVRAAATSKQLLSKTRPPDLKRARKHKQLDKTHTHSTPRRR